MLPYNIIERKLMHTAFIRRLGIHWKMEDNMQKNKYLCAVVILAAVSIAGCGRGTQIRESDHTQIQDTSGSLDQEEGISDDDVQAGIEDDTDAQKKNGVKESETQVSGEVNADRILDPEGMTLESRFAAPAGYQRTKAVPGSLDEFLRNYPLKEDGSPVLLYDGTLKGNQGDHAAVFALPLENEDLQQCADSVMRIYAEYFWETKQYERIAFHFVNGFCAEYAKWREGYRIQIDGNQAVWIKEGDYDDSYEAFCKYLRMVFSYAGTLSMDAESDAVSLADVRTGDIFLESGSPGHVVMLVDLCENAQGKKAFLLAQGFMPAQEFHVLKNPLHEEDPWYYEDEIDFPLLTPEYTFGEGSLRRLNYTGT